MQLAARRVANENQQLRTLLNQVGVDDDTVRNFLQSTESSEAIIESAGSHTSKLLPNANFPDTFIGEASPYSNHEDTTSLEDGCAGSPCGSETSTTLPPFELGLAPDPSKQSIFNQIMQRS
jgi:hypothetical protein